MVLKIQNRKESKGKEREKKKRRNCEKKLYIIVTKNRFLIMLTMNLDMLNQIKCYSMK